MSSNSLTTFLSLLHQGNWKKIIEMFYNPMISVHILKDNLRQLFPGIQNVNDIFLNAKEVLQYTVEDLHYNSNEIAFRIFMIVKDEDNELHFCEHQISNNWNNNKIIKHNHIIKSF